MRRRRTGAGWGGHGAGAAAPGHTLGRTCVAPSLDGAALDRLLIHCLVPNMEDIIIGSAHHRCWVCVPRCIGSFIITIYFPCPSISRSSERGGEVQMRERTVYQRWVKRTQSDREMDRYVGENTRPTVGDGLSKFVGG